MLSKMYPEQPRFDLSFTTVQKIRAIWQPYHNIGWRYSDVLYEYHFYAISEEFELFG